MLTKEVGLNLTGGPECLLFTAKPIIGSLICNSSTKTNVSNSGRIYIFDSEFAKKCSSRKLNADIADTLRTHIHENVQWAQDYRSAVDSVLNSLNLNDPNSPTPYIEFADVSRINDGPVLGEQVPAPEIAALVYTSGQQDSGKRAAVTYPVNSPDPKPRFLPLWNPAYELSLIHI